MPPRAWSRSRLVPGPEAAHSSTAVSRTRSARARSSTSPVVEPAARSRSSASCSSRAAAAPPPLLRSRTPRSWSWRPTASVRAPLQLRHPQRRLDVDEGALGRAVAERGWVVSPVPRRLGTGGDGIVDRGQGAGDVEKPVGLCAGGAELHRAVRLPRVVAAEARCGRRERGRPGRQALPRRVGRCPPPRAARPSPPEQRLGQEIGEGAKGSGASGRLRVTAGRSRYRARDPLTCRPPSELAGVAGLGVWLVARWEAAFDGTSAFEFGVELQP